MNIFQKFAEGISKTRETFFSGIFKNPDAVNEEFYEELEESMILSDMGAETTEYLLGRLRSAVKENKITDREEAKKILIRFIADLFQKGHPLSTENGSAVIIAVGVNGVGKTTTIGKLAYYFRQNGKSTVIAAADTFRAAASEQLSVWAERTDSQIVCHEEGSDPASVVYDAACSFKARNKDVLLVDTAGRLHNKANLMNELSKIQRVVNRELPGIPVEIFIVLDATTGQNAISQVKAFSEAVTLSGIIVTKLDGTAKGGILVALAKLTELPVRFVGLGEKVDNLEEFDAEAFAQALL